MSNNFFLQKIHPFSERGRGSLFKLRRKLFTQMGRTNSLFTSHHSLWRPALPRTPQGLRPGEEGCPKMGAFKRGLLPHCYSSVLLLCPSHPISCKVSLVQWNFLNFEWHTFDPQSSEEFWIGVWACNSVKARGLEEERGGVGPSDLHLSTGTLTCEHGELKAESLAPPPFSECFEYLFSLSSSHAS